VDAETAERLLSLPREIGPHPETGKIIKASIGRYGPYLEHDGKYARLSSTAEVFETGMNAAVAKLADAASGGGRREGASREPIAVLGAHPSSGKEIKVMSGRYGPYVTDGTTHATLPKTADPKEVTLAQAVEWIDAKAAKGPSTKSKKNRRERRRARPNRFGSWGLSEGGSFASRASRRRIGKGCRRRHRRCRRLPELP
jgi:DNA topoisomerase-1